MDENKELEDLDDLEGDYNQDEKIVLSNLYNIIEGGFGDLEGIKTYICNVRVKNLKNDIEVFEKLTDDKAWPVSQIIQREVDSQRIRDISRYYILGEGRLVKYFPPLIIALLPKSDEDRIKASVDFQEETPEEVKEYIFHASKYRDNDKVREYFRNADNISEAKGIYALNVFKTFDFKVLSWDKRKYFAIVIDGQHRLEALLKSLDKNPEVGNYLQDIVFLDFSQLIKSQDNKVTPIEAVRRVFVDINNNAVKVGIVRRILMDDKDLAALFVQSLVNEYDEENKLKNDKKYIKPQLIDWHGQSLKHTLPHLTGILTLHQIINDYVIRYNLSSIEDLRDKNKVKRWVQFLNDYFKIDEKIREFSQYDDYTQISVSLQNFEEDSGASDTGNDETDNNPEESAVFSYDYRILEIAKETFEEVLVQSIVYLFKNFRPYEDAISILEELKAFDKEHNLYKALISSDKKIEKNSNLADKYSEAGTKLENELNGDYYLLFSVLGQKTIFSLYFKEIFAKYNKNFSNDDALSVTIEFLEKVNKMVDIVGTHNQPLFGKEQDNNVPKIEVPGHYLGDLEDLGTIATSFWEGIIYQEKRIIYNSRGVNSLTSLIEYTFKFIDHYLKNNEPLEKDDFDISYFKSRVRRLVKRSFEDWEDEMYQQYAEKIVEAKRKFFNDYLVDCIKNWEK